VLQKTEMHREGNLVLRLRNLEDQAQRLHVRLLLPQELSTTSPAQDLSLASQQETSLKFPIRNFSALDGSVYAAYAIIEYENGGRHFTSMAPGTVAIRADKGFDQYWKYAAAALVLMMLLANVLPIRKKKPAPPAKK